MIEHNGVLTLDTAKGIGWFDKKRLRRLKAFVRLLKKKEKNIPKDQQLFEKIDELKIIYEDLLNYYHKHDSKFVKDLQSKLPKLDIESKEEITQLLTKLNKNVIDYYNKLKILQKKKWGKAA
ncbi:MAG: hypothetical protein ACTSW3_00590 [Promethearchaeota archaeon]